MALALTMWDCYFERICRNGKSLDMGKNTNNSPANGQQRDGFCIRIRGARVHNLKNVDVDIPRDHFVVITGPSGSGKSSLAFDTLFAEGQRQYIESLSVHARHFLHQMERPDVESIDGLQPTLSIDQHRGSQNPRSTVATVTEIYDFLRLLMARVGNPSCFKCGRSISQQSPEEIQNSLLRLPQDTKVMLLAPMVRGRKGRHQEVFSAIRKAGFVRVRVDGTIHDIEQVPDLAPRRVHHIEAIVDRVIIREGGASRLAESIRLALGHGDGLMLAYYLDPQDAIQATTADKWREKLFSTQYSCPQCETNYEELEPRTFSFNSPYGACPECEGLGTREEFDPDLVLPCRQLSLADGAVVPWQTATKAVLKQHQSVVQGYLEKQGIDWSTPLEKLSDKAFQTFLHGDGKTFLGVVNLLEKELATTTRKGRREQLEEFSGKITCHACGGARLRPEALSVRLGNQSIQEITALSVGKAHELFVSLDLPKENHPIAQPIVREIVTRLEFLTKVGVDYLTLDRSADTLSGGELQRVRLATSIGSGLVGVCYVLDEPSIGLHQRDNQRLIDALRGLQQAGNTVLVVEHDEAMMRQSDRIIDVGPGAGIHGGQVVAEGTIDQICKDHGSLTGRYLSGKESIATPENRRRITKSRSITIEGVQTNNLANVTVAIPLGVLVGVSGVSGSGKSSLINGTLVPALARRLGMAAPRPGSYQRLRGVSQIEKLVQIDQSPIGRTPRSNAATYTGVFDEIRKVFANTREAKQRGFRSSRFSFNVKGGRCEECRGQGLQKIEMNFLPDLYVTCPTCNGARFNHQTLEVRYREKTIAQVLELRVDEALTFFENFPLIHRLVVSLDDVGLGYLSLGQPSTTLSGGEAQRIKLATQLARAESGKTVYVLDEPTTGLHTDDIKKLLNVLNHLVDKGNSVIVIEHNLDVIKSADWVIDLGPEGGDQGGRIMACGAPEDIAAMEDNHTGRFLSKAME